MSTPTSSSPEAMWEEEGARIYPCFLRVGEALENCVFVKPYTPTTYNPVGDGVVEVVFCAENNIAAAVMYNVHSDTPAYSPASQYRRNFRMARHFKCRMRNEGIVVIPPYSPITTGPNGHMKLCDAAALLAGARVEGYTEADEVAVDEYGKVVINDG